VGCGTGEHLAALRARGIAVEGVDASAAMVAQARRRHPDIPFQVARGQDFRLSPRRDAISLLFHVIDYQVTDEEVDALLGNLAAHLAPDGVLVFDFWHSGGVAADPPAPRGRQASVGGRPLFRLADPTEDRAQRRVDVRYEFRWDHPSGELVHEELHRMRHFARQELERFLGRAGLRPLCCEAWRERRPLRGDDWYGVLCARPAVAAP
jgi:SAM-dependent methyltransferase